LPTQRDERIFFGQVLSLQQIQHSAGDRPIAISRTAIIFEELVFIDYLGKGAVPRGEFSNDFFDGCLDRLKPSWPRSLDQTG
jgi:hypothetical protein